MHGEPAGNVASIREAPAQTEPNFGKPFYPLTLFIFVTSISLSVPVAHAQQQASRPADPPSFLARDLLDAKLLRSPHYTIDENVPLRDDRYVFTLRTRDAVIIAHGMPMLQVRLDEIEAIQKARKLDEKPQEMEGIKDSFEQTGRGLKSLFTDPGETLANIPRGLGRKVKSMTRGDKGGGTTRRQFAAAVGADPETDNPPLKKLLDKLALRRGIGKGAVAVGGFLVTAGAANLAMVVRGAGALRTSADMNEAVRTLPLYKINEKIAAELVAMGISPQLREAFIEHESMTTVQRMLFVQQFKPLHRITGSPLLVRHALKTTNRAQALALIHALELLVQVHTASPLEEFLDSTWLLARGADGSLLCVSAADYLTASSRQARGMETLRARHAGAALTLLAAGKVAPDARQALNSLQIRVIENGDTAAVGG